MISSKTLVFIQKARAPPNILVKKSKALPGPNSMSRGYKKVVKKSKGCKQGKMLVFARTVYKKLQHRIPTSP